jgi:hypothetical protein
MTYSHPSGRLCSAQKGSTRGRGAGEAVIDGATKSHIRDGRDGNACGVQCIEAVQSTKEGGGRFGKIAFGREIESAFHRTKAQENLARRAVMGVEADAGAGGIM